ncbi:Kinetochore-Ndc80 complex, subunit Spc25 [Halosimplex carlsbadense 2-9-1]|uniref:Kinetochore-Ndc80 complex, subunit Spc25 n=1 Tax=Halosimplex carlsbadense 2-9-1 TaxID=797114 RepID=M0CK93_9EURY|nr:archaea-specific SMC-related protein [Halosimplex carlsbadense]ELZ22309.1 Kinetochore-Ndc80 complex, subunit Spc25 [Halosimplex carlsbadense 2-9-1]
MDGDRSESTVDDGAGTASVSVRNVGGIEATTVDLDPGVTVLAGRNATNRTSFLRAIRAVLGGEATPLRRGADAGRVELTVGGDTHTRRFERTDDGVVAAGDPYLDDPRPAETYAVLLEDNDVRRAVRAGDDLAEVVMRPVDTDAIEAEIERLTAEKRRVDEDLSGLEGLGDERTELAAERRRLEAEIEGLESDLADLEAAIEAADASLDDGIERDERLEARLDELRAARTDLESVIEDLDAERDTLAAVEREREEIERDLAAVSPVDEAELDALSADIAALRERKRQLDGDVSALQGIVRFNESQLEEGRLADLAEIGRGEELRKGDDPTGDDARADDDGLTGDDLAGPASRDDERHVTDRLAGTDRVTCWTCGSSVDRGSIEETLDRLRDLRERRLSRRRDLTARIDRLDARRERLERRRERRADLRAERDRVESELSRREERIGDLERRRRELNDHVRDLEATVEDLRTEDYADLLDLHRRANERQVELEQRRSDQAAVESELAALDERLDERDRLEARREELQSDLVERRTRLDRTAAEAVATFNDHADALVDALDYGNVARVRLTRTTATAGTGRSGADVGSFDIRVVREGDEGAFEDSPTNLSESEREVVGLVLALAGYLVHDVHERCPFLLLDSLEAVDAERIAELVDYFADHATYLVVALLEADASAVGTVHDRVTEI